MALDVTPDSLVLLDEIGSATDPEEGGALGVALVDHFRLAGAFTIASTHLTALKIYGASTQTVLNASMGFDEQTLDPTYRLRVGLPGKSAGLDIAERLGMPEDILKRARASLSTKEAELSELIADLHNRLEESTRLKEALERERIQIAIDAARNEAAKMRELEERFEVLEKRWIERADEAMAKLDKKNEVQRQTSKVRREMREDWETIVPSQQPLAAPKTLKIEEGARVRIKGIRDPARVRRDLGNGRYEVEAGFMKVQVSAADIEEVLPESPVVSKLPKNVTFRPGPALSPLEQEINVIGEHAEEAIDRVERFLDAAVMATSARVRIVHGHGMGVLKRAVADLLKNNPHVAKFYPASQFEGGSGATIVELKE
jgi:DNA mismatch repair protein MutS2